MAPVQQTTLAPPAAPTTPADRHASRRGSRMLAALLVVVIALDVGYLAIHGTVDGGDTPRYVEGGHALFHGDALSGRQALYVGYILLVGLIQVAGLGSSAIAVAQIVLSVAATAAVFAL